MKRVNCLLIAIPVLLSGCNLYTRYERQPLEYDVAEIADNDTLASPMSYLSWRKLFKDSCLQTWIEEGLRSNTDLRIAQLRVDEAEATLSASRLAFLPSANLNVDGNVGHKSTNRFSIGPSASWEVDIFGKQRNLKLGAEASFYASESIDRLFRHP